MLYFGVKFDAESGEVPVEFVTSKEKTIPVSDEVDVEGAPEQEARPDSIIDLQQNFFDQIHAYIDGLPALISMKPLLQAAAYGRMVNAIKKDLSSGAPGEVDGWTFYDIPSQNSERLYREQNLASRRAAALDGIAEMVLLGAVSQFDAFLGRLLRLCIDKRPDIVSKSEKQFPAHTVLEYSDMDAFRHAVTEKTVESFLRKSHQDQFDWLEDNFKVKLRKDLPNWPVFIETFERRNLFAHSQGVVSETYRLKCLEAGLDSVPAVGEVLSADPEYIDIRLQVFAEIGLKLAQVLGRVLEGDEENLKRYDAALNHFSYQLIGHGHYDLAATLLQFGIACPKHPDDEILMMMEVNLGNAYMLNGKPVEAEKVLSARQWHTTSIDFEISVEAIRGDAEKVANLMARFYPKQSSPEWCLRHWPVFAQVREKEQFQEAYKVRFGTEYTAAFDVMVPKQT